jgi:hypothetical protein
MTQERRDLGEGGASVRRSLAAEHRTGARLDRREPLG